MSVKERWKGINPLKYNTERASNIIVTFLREYSCIKLIYLFGSRVLNDNSLQSDIDIAFFTSKDFTWKDYYLIAGKCGQKLSSDRIDLIWLNQSEPILTFEIIKNGNILFYSDPELLNNFELYSKKRYYDYCFYLKKHKRFQEYGLKA